jgi:hypothetical protein
MSFDNVVSVTGTVVPLASAVASALNQSIRSQQAEGKQFAPWFLNVAAVLNVFALNLDKAKQLLGLLKAG